MSGIGGISGVGYDLYQNSITREDLLQASGLQTTDSEQGKTEGQIRAEKRAGIEECDTCKNRKYQDGSDENVSFKSASHVSPEAAGAAVRGHEAEHVANAYDKAKQDGGKVLQASVAIHTAICPECGRTYVSGGETTTQIMYKNEDNPYQKTRKVEDADKYTGMNINIAG